MRCSSRNSDMYCSFITSTPLPRGRISYWAPCLSPITETAPVKKFSLATGNSLSKHKFVGTLGSSMQKPRNFPPLVIASSDSEDDEMFPISKIHSTRKSSKKPAKLEKVESKGKEPRLRRGGGLKERPTNFLEEISAGIKRGAGRNAKVDAFIDEIVKENMEPSYSPPEKKKMSEDSVDAIIEKVITANDTKATKRTRRNSKKSRIEAAAQEQNQEDNKENLVRKIVNGSHVVDLFVVKDNPQIIRRSVKKKPPLPDSTRKSVANNLDLRQEVSENKAPVVHKLCDAGWKPINSHEGVYVSKQFSTHLSATSYIKVDAKCAFKKKSSCSQVVIVSEGLGFVLANDTKTNVSQGDMIRISTGSEYEIINRGIKKALILSIIELGNV